MKKLVFSCSLIFILGIFGCANNNLTWFKQGSKPNEFNETKYDCLKNSQQVFSTSNSYNSGGIISPNSFSSSDSSSGIKTNEQLFTACMNSRGWILVNTSQNSTKSNVISNEEASRICLSKKLIAGTYPFDECVKSYTGG
jgi:hypothetical protein